MEVIVALMSEPSQNTGAVDIDRLMDELRQRVQDKKARGLYRVDELVEEALDDDQPWDAHRLEELHRQALIEQKMLVPESTRPVVGSLIQRIKRFVMKAGWHNLANVTEQTTSFNAGMISYSASVATEVTRLRHELDQLRAESGASDLNTLTQRLDALETATLADRVGRLERRLDGTAGEPPPLRAAGERLDALRLEAWLGDDSAAALAAAVEGCASALHLGCGAGEILDKVGGVGVDSYGDLVAKARDAGREVLHADPVGYVASATAGSHDAITVVGLPEQLEPESLTALIRGIASALDPNGVVALAVRNPNSEQELLSFWRDPRRRRPVDPATIAFLLECEGFAPPELRWEEEDGNAAPRSCVVVARR
jgi:hypothetical protein